MRLLKTGPYLPGREKLELIERYGDQIPPYAILSHRWQEDEVLYIDIERGTAHLRKAYGKLTAAFDQARKDGYGFLWIDTCCIDKSSSAELSEAINSMYVWYERSQKCYAFLDDVSDDLGDAKAFQVQFEGSKWFTRGWTLQELLAPRDLEFFSCDWVPLGDRVQLQALIAKTTRVDVDYVTHYRPVQEASVAARMSWAASRRTTREEDMAYCLIGLFNVNMPMLYGEGQQRAFIRLQEEIMRNSDDHSIFAWTARSYETAPDKPSTGRRHGLLADHPSAFRDSGAIISYSQITEESPYDMSNRGLSITLPLHMPKATLDKDLYVGALECHHNAQTSQYLGIYLRRLYTGPQQFARVDCHKLVTGPLANRGRPARIYVRQSAHEEQSHPRQRYVQLRANSAVTVRWYEVVDVLWKESEGENVGSRRPAENSQARTWMPGKYPTVFVIPQSDRTLSVAITFTKLIDEETLVLLLGSTTEYQIGFCAYKARSLFEGYQKWSEHFEKNVKPIGEPWMLEHHSVQIRVVSAYVQASHKLYTIDIDIQPLTPMSTGEMVVEDLVDHLPVQRFGKMSSLFRRDRM